MAYVETTAVWFLNTLNLYASVGYVSISLWIKKREEEQEKKEEATVVWPPEAHVTVHKCKSCYYGNEADRPAPGGAWALAAADHKPWNWAWE